MLKIATDFSGVGSPETALKRLGIEHQVLFACDIDKYARKSYGVLHNPQQMFEDITTRPMDFPQLDLYVAGFPCQSFSTAGSRKGFDCPTNGTLFHTLSEFIRINQPKCFILENVKGLINHDNGRTFQIIKDKLSGTGGSVNEQMFLTDIDGLGYHIHLKVLNTKDFGLPQNRERIFIVGFKDSRQFSFPNKIKLDKRLKDILQDNPNSKYYLSDNIMKRYHSGEYKYSNEINQSINQDISTCIDASYFKGFGVRNGKCRQLISNIYIPVNEKYFLSKEAIDKINRHNNKSFDNTISNTIHAGYFKQGGRDQQYIEVPQKYYLSDKIIKGFQNHKERHQEKGTGFQWIPKTEDDIANCLRANASLCPTDNSIIVHSTHTQNSQAVDSNKRIRRLTPLECFRLQGFTDEEHSLCEEVQSDTQLYKQMGNTISVPVIQAILKNIYNA